ncbi:MAG: 23S rRNA (pseudouridine(1915)-N(3))-methyltransferase RlmH [Candidatus Delongbacteria bacterium]|nr:23S rRNA (pseudouridine(1915)-N(3))-methyltransferase RlmH [Candidatus Delongbacteria bacterium]MBN2836713.1 23S rRNA (pseudouridine(1915)-N(3))-methyltransferase RlmH [Candidatus Delongbacteria bacterium]
MKITVLGIGKTKFDFLESGIDRYIKLVKPYAKVEFINLKEESTKPDCIDLESEKLIKHIPKNSFSILMDISGVDVSSTDFADIIQNVRDSSKELCFIIGGHLGVNNSVRNVVDKRVSFSKLTFTHQMIRLLLAEQIYRGFSIINNLNYHK